MQFLKKIITVILTVESRLILSKYRPFIVAVTGSVGKTSTKDAIYTVLRDHGKYVRKSEKSMNSEIGLPLTVIGAPNAWHSLSGWLANILKGFGLILKKSPYPDCLILEIGADHPGDIKRVAKWLKPDIAVITRVSRTPVHVEFFNSPEEVFEEKASLATSVRSGGTVVLFADDDKVLSMAGMVKAPNVGVLTFGLSDRADIKGLNDRVMYEGSSGQPTGMSFDIALDGKNHSIEMKGVIGSVYMYPLLASVAVAKARGIDLGVAIKALSQYEPPKGRMNLVEGINGSTIIDDSYNSSPDATISALSALKDLQTSGRKIAILGDMMELGKYASEEHRNIGKHASSIVSELITVGSRSRVTAEEAVNGGLPKDKVHSFDRSSEVAGYLAPLIGPNDVILVKGSQSIRMEKAVSALLKEPQKADRLLVRQEREWLKKE